MKMTTRFRASGHKGRLAALVGAALLSSVALTGGASAADDISGDITVWSWNTAAIGLKSVIPAFNKLYPNVKVDVQDLGNQPVYDRGLAGCAAGGADMPDVYSVENGEAEVFWARFPECFSDLKATSADEAKLLTEYPAFKLTELTVGDKIYGLPWDSGPVVAFYRRDIFDKAGVDVASIKTWDDYVAAGKEILAATDGKVKMASLNGDTSWFRMLSNQAGCGYFDETGENVTINQPGCVQALETIKKVSDAGLLSNSNWDETLQALKGDVLAGAVYGGWYEGSIRNYVPDQSGKWGAYLMPALAAGGNQTANIGGSSLAIPSSSKNPKAALAFVNFAVGTVEGQVTQLKDAGLVPTLPAAVDDAYVASDQAYWGNQKFWQLALSTLPSIKPSRGTQYFAEADQAFNVIYVDFLAGKYGSAKEALDAAAQQIAGASGLPVAP